MTSIYINLPVSNLAKATAFYEAIGFVKNLSFSNDDASALTWDETLSVMLLTHEFYTKFLSVGKTIASNTASEVLNAIQFDSKEAVDAFFDKAIAAGWTKTIDTQDHGFMYGKDFEDLDGHIWEAFWMDETALPQA